jgi:hypothetical protein
MTETMKRTIDSLHRVPYRFLSLSLSLSLCLSLSRLYLSHESHHLCPVMSRSSRTASQASPMLSSTLTARPPRPIASSSRMVSSTKAKASNTPSMPFLLCSKFIQLSLTISSAPLTPQAPAHENIICKWTHTCPPCPPARFSHHSVRSLKQKVVELGLTAVVLFNESFFPDEDLHLLLSSGDVYINSYTDEVASVSGLSLSLCLSLSLTLCLSVSPHLSTSPSLRHSRDGDGSRSALSLHPLPFR